MAKTWLITGSSRGIGRALAESVLASGDNLVATARKVSGLEVLTAPFGDRAMIVPLDVANFPAACFGRISPVPRPRFRTSAPSTTLPSGRPPGSNAATTAGSPAIQRKPPKSFSP
jgi:short subunit dehydrogenase